MSTHYIWCQSQARWYSLQELGFLLFLHISLCVRIALEHREQKSSDKREFAFRNSKKEKKSAKLDNPGLIWLLQNDPRLPVPFLAWSCQSFSHSRAFPPCLVDNSISAGERGKKKGKQQAPAESICLSVVG